MKCTVLPLLLLLVLFAIPSASEARTLDFPQTPVQQVTVADGSWSDKIQVTADADTGHGYRYSDAGDELGVVVLDAPLTEALRTVLGSKSGALVASDVAALGKTGNPWIIRYCAERGTPALTELAGRKFLVCEFVQEQLMRVAVKGRAVCQSAFKAEAHAFTIDRDKLVHIYLVRSRVGDVSPDEASVLKPVAERFYKILSTVVWH